MANPTFRTWLVSCFRWRSIAVALLANVALAFFLLALVHLVFYLLNARHIPSVQQESTSRLIIGILHLDAATLAYALGPYLLLATLPLQWRYRRGFQLFLKVLFLVGMTATLVINLLDCAYFSTLGHTLSAHDLANLSQALTSEQLLDLFLDYWFLFLPLPPLVYLVARFYRTYTRPRLSPEIGMTLLRFGMGLIPLALLVGAMLYLTSPTKSSANKEFHPFALRYVELPVSSPLIQNGTLVTLHSLREKRSGEGDSGAGADE